MFDISKLYEPKSVAEAIELMQKHPEAHILAGGSDLLIKIREGALAGAACISIYKLDELRGVSMEEDGTIVIRPLTSFARAASDPILNEHIFALSEAAGTAGGPQIRNIGTIGGNICNGVTSADTASTCFAYGAVLELTGPEGARLLPIAEFYAGPGKTHIRPAELLTAVRFPVESYRGYAGKYIKYSMRRAMDIATLGCSVNVKLSPDKKQVWDVRIAYGVAAATPLRCSAAEGATCGQPVSEKAVEQFVQAALGEISPRSSWRASKELRMQLAAEMARRAFKEAISRAGGTL